VFHVEFGFGDVVCWAGYASGNGVSTREFVGRGGGVRDEDVAFGRGGQILWVLIRSVLQITVSSAGIWSIQLHASFFFAAGVLVAFVVTPAPPVFLPFLTLAATGLASASSRGREPAEDPLTFSAAERTTVIEMHTAPTALACLPSRFLYRRRGYPSSSLNTRSTTPVSPSKRESRSVDMTGPGTTSACLRIERKVSKMIGR